jgi:hypothetical protein
VRYLNEHDPMCPFPAWARSRKAKILECQCDFIAAVRADEAPKAVDRWVEQGAASDDWMKVWQVRDYAEELEAKVRADTLYSVINLLEEMHSERVWWNDMLTWCISVNEAISQIDNIRWEKEEV